MTVYSHSRLSCYEQCPARFKFQYIDKVETEVEESVEAFLGVRVHETLEKLYRDLGFQKRNSLEDLLIFLRKEWEDNWSDDVVIVRSEYAAENYLRMGEQYVSDYYRRYQPFTQGRTIALEERIMVSLDAAGAYTLQGYIDRLTETEDGCYEIHDYKTNSRLPLPAYLQSDRQLALYMIGVKDSYPDVRSVRLVWHFLKFDKEVDSTRSDRELEELKRATMSLIDRIESDTEYRASPGSLCGWCEFQSCCGQWRHLYKVRELPANEYLADSGVKLVNRYAELKSKQKTVNNEFEDELGKLEEALLGFAEKEKVECVFGSKNKIKISETERLCFPSKDSKERGRLEEALRTYGKLQEVQQLDTTALAEAIKEKAWGTEVLESLRKYVEVERKKRLWLSKLKEK